MQRNCLGLNLTILAISIYTSIASFSFAGLTTSHLNSEDDQPYCKVNKPLITISAGTAIGTITITGTPGSISSTSAATAYAKNVETGTRADITLAEDYSFTVQLTANPGHKIRVYSSNRQGKRSYGTFEVPNLPQSVTTPQPSAAVDTASARPLQPAAAIQQPADSSPIAANIPDTAPTQSAIKEYSIVNLESTTRPALMVNGEQVAAAPQPIDDPTDGTNLAVVIMIVNTDSGQVLSTTQITGKSKTYAEKSPENFKIMIQRILDRCKNIISSEILRPNLDRPATKSPQPSTTTN